MDRLIYTAAAGARALVQRQDGIANNLANANTTGYRADQVAFRAVPVRGDGAPTRVVSLEASAGFDERSGPIEQTGRNLDVAVLGKGYLAVQAGDGGEAYTRGGALQVNDQGVLVTSAGQPVAGEGGPLNIPVGSTVTIGHDGTVSAQPARGPAQTVGRLKLVNPEPGELRKGDDGLLRMRSGEDAPADETVRVAAGALEGSNVNVVEAMVGMIAASRQFETQMKLLQTAEQNDQRAAQLLAPAR
ncbi:MAG TPA: flagellar basal-body rod protein FlgF [Ramlibacter sp.]|jgi:flagellar basal-body rod protein FlgF|uniref:flagellar basal-body rod protein FlgF n=1 Tax=Ramlibacter sp. TaxID=1917967 RepID=UPI002D63ACA9|nr:flagellar basal-body rod protein FlgF [Ramlibacter sp.]HZY18569.1 flagellar basal-body rod protein FlgF [Ramlibacter sp.]